MGQPPFLVQPSPFRPVIQPRHRLVQPSRRRIGDPFAAQEVHASRIHAFEFIRRQQKQLIQCLRLQFNQLRSIIPGTTKDEDREDNQPLHPTNEPSKTAYRILHTLLERRAKLTHPSDAFESNAHQIHTTQQQPAETPSTSQTFCFVR